MIDWNARQRILSFITEHPRCLSRDIASALGLTIREATDACTFMHRGGAIERNAGLFATWSIRTPPEPSVSVSGKAYQRWADEAKRRGVPLQRLVAQALEAV